MYFLRYENNNKTSLGFMNYEKTKIIPVQNLEKFESFNNNPNMNDLIDCFSDDDINLIEKAFDGISLNFLTLNDIKVLAPIEFSKRNIFCLGKNYLDHINEVQSMPNVKGDVPSHPIYFSKTCSPSIGPNDSIVIDKSITKSVDYEVELALIIKKQGKNISKEKAREYIFGYTIVNDVSARDLQVQHIQWHKGKSLDTFTPMGPYIVHASKVNYPVDLEIKCWVNDELRQNSKTSKMIFDIDYIISDLSKGTTLYPGDIILTGTPAGVGMGFKPPKLLTAGDIVKCEIEKIGTLISYVK
jgi:2-keto-4-pentenoate hydratase/2-oxohepta-3-ene-1,7-dioic acid hydratase in catechol pathway